MNLGTSRPPHGLEHSGPKEWRRQIDRVNTHEPTSEDWDEYRRGVALLEELRGNKFYEEGGPDYGSEIEEPCARIETVYAETRQEWEARVAKMAEQRGGYPTRNMHHAPSFANVWPTFAKPAPTNRGSLDLLAGMQKLTPSQIIYAPHGIRKWDEPHPEGKENR